MVIYTDTKVKIFHKIYHIHKIGKCLHKNFTKDVGDIPVIRFNKITGKIEEVENRRGIAYAARKRLKYRKGKKCLK